MIYLICIFSELTRAQKVEIFNCFTNLADINLFADTKNIIITLQTTNNQACDLPHGIKVSLQIDSLGVYEPYTYVKDYDYATTTTIYLKCSNAGCSSIPSSASGIIIIESKTKVTRIPAGSVRVQRGAAHNCFNDNDTYSEQYQGYIILGTTPTYNCVDDIASTVNGVLTLNTVNAAKIYVTYSDDSMSIFQDVSVQTDADVFVPTTTITDSSVYLRIRFTHPSISQNFNQSISNDQITKDVKFIQFDLYFQVESLQPTSMIKVMQVTSNYYNLPGFPGAYQTLDLKVVGNGFLVQRSLGPNSASYNQELVSLGATSYVVEYIFSYADNARTDEFRVKLVARTTLPDSISFVNTPIQRTCEARFPNQNCSFVLQKLTTVDVSTLYSFMTFYYYAGTELVGNFSRMISTITDSCFSTGEANYDYHLQVLEIELNMNYKSQSCQLDKNDQIVVKILLANTSANMVIDTKTIDYVPGIQKYQVTGIVIVGHPEIRIQYIRDNQLMDVASITEYVIHEDKTIFIQEIYIVLKILGVNFGVVLVYLIWIFAIYPVIVRCRPVKVQKANYLISEDEGEVQ
ncbi:Conserved_hypothetical protein [Hexamita inflata]|uniref:Uncharacterized protein n=1 Tax=Hexamita inflata TaxID=28002 RepID=A0AA86V3T6_9EUKA|nr:Conserved hypothetical protein [Hexamita inflata]